MFGLNCTKCERPLTWPFSSLVFTESGDEYEVRNKLPEVSDGDGSVVVYMHGSCKRQGRYSAKMIRRAAKASSAPKSVARIPSVPRGTRQVLRDMGFDVSANGHRILMVFPRLMAGAVKKMQ